MNYKNAVEGFFNGRIPSKDFDEHYASLARIHQDSLTKPKGSLGNLEKYSIWMAGWQKKIKPTMDNFKCIVFAGNHGVAKKDVSAYPADVTSQMVTNFKNGGAAINQLCNLAKVMLSIVPIELEKPTKDLMNFISLQ